MAIVPCTPITFFNPSDGIAVDWVSNKLYWTDAFYLTVEVIDLASFERKTLFSLASGSTPRAIVVDPATR